MIFFNLSLLLTAIASLVVSALGQQCSQGLSSSFDNNKKITFRRPNLSDRKYRIYTPAAYDPSVPSKIVLYFHGYCGSGFVSEKLQAKADRFNYIVVAPTGLKSNRFECNSWQNYGSTTGFDPTGTQPICDITQGSDYCPSSCAPCANRCPWSQCLDDDVDFVRDLITGGVGFENVLQDKVCFDPSNVFVMGNSNGGMFTWTLVQDERTAPLFAAGAPIIGSPHCGYNFAAPTTRTPMISFMGKSDDTVSPTNLPFPGQPTDECIINRDGDGYGYIAGPAIMKTWAKAGPKRCSDNVIDGAFPSRIQNKRNLQCFTWCRGKRVYAKDCYFDGGHIEPKFVLKKAFKFFEMHSN